MDSSVLRDSAESDPTVNHVAKAGARELGLVNGRASSRRQGVRTHRDGVFSEQVGHAKVGILCDCSLSSESVAGARSGNACI